MARVSVVSDKSAAPVVGAASAPMALDIDLTKITTLALFDAHMRVLRQSMAELGLK